MVSTESSGGGLPYFGVFANEQIRTVYLDMRQTEDDETPLWTVEFAVPGNTAVQKKLASELEEEQKAEQGQPEEEGQAEEGIQPWDEIQLGDEAGQGADPGTGDEDQREGETQKKDDPQDEFVLPVPIVKESPALPPELVRLHVGGWRSCTRLSMWRGGWSRCR